MIEKPIDIERERSERKLSAEEFLHEYNADLPVAFPKAKLAYLAAYRREHPNVFKKKDVWTLGDHRKKFMDWLPQHLKEHEPRIEV